VVHISIWGVWSFVSEGISLPKSPHDIGAVAKLQRAY